MITADRADPNRVAVRLIGRDYISYSALNTYRACPLRFKFRYVDGLPEESVSASLVFGSAIHRAAELHYNRLLAGDPLPSLDELLVAYHNAERIAGEVRPGVVDELTSMSGLAARMLAAFQASSIARPSGTVLGVEEELRGSIVPGVPDVLGRIDLLVEESDTLVLTDFKTSRSRWTRDQAEDAGEQLLLYSELVKELAPGKPLRIQFAVLTKTKLPVLDLHEFPVAPARVSRIKRIVERVWRSIEAEHFYPSPSPMQCSGCPFRAPCRVWTGL